MLGISGLTSERLTHIFWELYDTINHVVTLWPNFGATGFAISYALVIVSFPFFLLIVLYIVWSIASVGPARKTLSSLLIIILAPPLYPLLTGLVLAIFWVTLSFIALAIGIVGPIFLITLAYVGLCNFAFEFVEKQRNEEVIVEDMSFGQLLCGLIMGLFCLCTFGLLALVLTLLKSPFVFLSCVLHYIYHSFFALKELRWWCIIGFIGWCFSFVLGVCILVLAIALSALAKFLLAGIWPAYVSAGWLRYFGPGGRRRDVGCCAPLVQGVKAGYQVVWAADLLTNTCILMRFDVLQRTIDEFAEIATGDREQLSPECRAISCLPPVVVGIFQDSWDVAERAIAQELGVHVDTVKEAWASFKEQMIEVGEQSLKAGLLTEDYVLCVPPELVVGLPARVLLDTVERSSEEGIRLANGLVLREDERPHTLFADNLWEALHNAREARAALHLTPQRRSLLCASLLAGGGEPGDLPEGLQASLREFERLPPAAREGCEAVRRHLVAAAVECSRQAPFRKQLERVVAALSSRDKGKPADGAAARLLQGRANSVAMRQRQSSGTFGAGARETVTEAASSSESQSLEAESGTEASSSEERSRP